MSRIRHPPEDDIDRSAALAILFGTALLVVMIVAVAAGTLISGAGQCG